jgi:hypothetical protein
MATYGNGNIPYNVVSVVLASGTDSNGYWEFRCTPAFAHKWAAAKKNAERLFGKTIYIRTGWNVYRPFQVQKDARTRACASGNCNGASVAGYSSHGGNWQGRDCLAVDVDPNGLTWDQVDRAMEPAGFSARLITEKMSGIPGGERWHYIDFDAFGPVPAAVEVKPIGSESSEEEDMALPLVITVSHPVSGTNGQQIYWSVDLAARTKSAIRNGVELEWRRALNIPEYVNQSPAVLDGYIEIGG